MSGKKRGHKVDDNDMIDYDHENRENGSHEEEEDHDNNDDDRHGRNNNSSNSNKKRKKSKKIRPSKIMSESGQTDADRRLLRARQRELHNDIAVGGGDGNNSSADMSRGDGGDGDELTRLRTQNNDLWRDVRYTREAVLDSENVDLIASKAARQAEKVVQVSQE